MCRKGLETFLAVMRRGNVMWSWRHRKSFVHRCRRLWVLLLSTEVAIVHDDHRRGATWRREGETQPYDLYLSSAGRAGTSIPSHSLPWHLHERKIGWSPHATRVTNTGRIYDNHM